MVGNNTSDQDIADEIQQIYLELDQIDKRIGTRVTEIPRWDSSREPLDTLLYFQHVYASIKAVRERLEAIVPIPTKE